MEALKGLEARIKLLIELTSKLKEENACLRADKLTAETRCQKLESSVEQDSKHVGKLKEEQELTKMAVDDLIKSIDTLVAHEEQSQ